MQMVDNGFMVLIDNHLAEDPTATDNSTLWTQYYEQLITGIAGMGKQYQNSVMVDILNEPDARGLECVPPSWILCCSNASHPHSFDLSAPCLAPPTLLQN